MISGISLLAQAPPAPPSSANQGGTGPVDGGIILLISLAAGYGGKKVFDARKK